MKPWVLTLLLAVAAYCLTEDRGDPREGLSEYVARGLEETVANDNEVGKPGNCLCNGQGSFFPQVNAIGNHEQGCKCHNVRTKTQGPLRRRRHHKKKGKQRKDHERKSKKTNSARKKTMNSPSVPL